MQGECFSSLNLLFCDIVAAITVVFALEKKCINFLIQVQSAIVSSLTFLFPGCWASGSHSEILHSILTILSKESSLQFNELRVVIAF